jgi:tetratricopeptide (TPR) repeat protein
MALAEKQEEMGLKESARFTYDRVRAANPKDAETWRKLAKAYTKLGDGLSAQEAWTKVLEFTPGDEEAAQGMTTPIDPMGRNKNDPFGNNFGMPKVPGMDDMFPKIPDPMEEFKKYGLPGGNPQPPSPGFP